MTPEDDATGLMNLIRSTFQDAYQSLNVALLREHNQGKCCDRPAAHRIYIAQRIRRRNTAEYIRVIHDWSEKINSLDQCEGRSAVRREIIHSRVIGIVVADEHPIIHYPRHGT